MLYEVITFGAYHSLYREQRLNLSCELQTAPARAAGDLLVQALDKLLRNNFV